MQQDWPQSGALALTSNRFDLLRLVFALAVFGFHAWALMAIAPFGPVEAQLGRLAEISIQGFFIVSGALVYGSLERSRSLASYGEKRVRRLYPAYATIVILPAIISGVLTGWADPMAIGRYLGANLVFLNFLEPALPGLFQENRFTEVNGALWTLKIEVMFYLVLPVLGAIMAWLKRQWWLLIALLYAGGEAWRLLLPVLLDHPLAPDIARQLPGQMAFFASGMALWKLWDMAKTQALAFGLAGIVLVAMSFLHPWLEPLRAAGLAGLIAGVAFAPGPALNAARFGDVSYGVYITHFPILQALIMTGAVAALSAGAAMGVALVLVLLASACLWHFVERPALRRDSHYRRAESEG